MNKKEKREIRKGLLENVALGLIEMTKDKNGKYLFKITKKGRDYVEVMPFADNKSSAK